MKARAHRAPSAARPLTALRALTASPGNAAVAMTQPAPRIKPAIKAHARRRKSAAPTSTAAAAICAAKSAKGCACPYASLPTIAHPTSTRPSPSRSTPANRAPAPAGACLTPPAEAPNSSANRAASAASRTAKPKPIVRRASTARQPATAAASLFKPVPTTTAVAPKKNVEPSKVARALPASIVRYAFARNDRAASSTPIALPPTARLKSAPRTTATQPRFAPSLPTAPPEAIALPKSACPQCAGGRRAAIAG